MRLRALLFVAGLGVLPAMASEQHLGQAAFPTAIQDGDATLVRRQEGVLSYFFVQVYSAALFTPPDIDLAELDISSDPFRLDIFYHRKIERDEALKLAWATLRRQLDNEQLARLTPSIDSLHSQIANIRPGDRYSLSLHSKPALTLSRNGETVFTSDDPELAQVYARMWLGEDGISRRLRRILLSEK